MDTLFRTLLSIALILSSSPALAETKEELPQGLQNLLELSQGGAKLQANLEEAIKSLSKKVEGEGPHADGSIFELETDGITILDQKDEKKVNIDQLVKDAERTVNEALEMKASEVPEIDVKKRSGLIARILSFGHVNALHRLVNKTMQKLRYKGDSTKYEVILTGSPMPNAAIYPGKSKMLINAGLIGWTKNEDEFAGVIAHEMTHDNMEMFKAMEDAEEVEEMLSGLKGYNDLDPAQREEIRADIGAVERLIQAGYNPWSYYNFEKRFTSYMHKSIDARITKSLFKVFFKRSFDYWEAHPAGEIRMSAAKAYIVHRSRKTDLSEQVKSYQKLSIGMKLMSLRMRAFSEPLMNIWVQRAVYGFLGYNFVNYLYTAFTSQALVDSQFAKQVTEVYNESETLQAVGETVTQATDAVGYGLGRVGDGIGYGFGKVGDVLSYIFSPLRSLYDFADAQVGGDLGFYLWWAFVARLMYPYLKSIYKVSYKEDSGYQSFKSAKKEYIDIFTKEIKSLLSFSTKTVNERKDVLKKKLLVAKHLGEIYEKTDRALMFFSPTNGIDLMSVTVNPLIVSSLKGFLKLYKKGEIHKYKIKKIIKQTLRDLPMLAWGSPGIISIFLEYEKLGLLDMNSDVGLDAVPNMAKMEGKVDVLSLLKKYEELRLRPLKLKVKVTDVEEALKLASIFIELGFYKAVPRLLGLYPRSAIRYVFSEKNKNPELVKKLTDSIVTMQKEGPRMERLFFMKYFYDQIFVVDQIGRVFNKTPNRLIHTELTKDLKISGWSWFNLRYWLEWGDRGRLFLFFRTQFKSISAITQFVNENIKTKNISDSTFSRQLFSAIRGRDHLIQSEKEVDLLLENDFFWISVGNSMNNPGYLEEIFVEVIKENVKKFPEVWKYEPSSSEAVHQMIMKFLVQSKSLRLSSVEEKIKLWNKLTERGVTSVTDQLFHDIYESSHEETRLHLEEEALVKGKVWETEIKQSIAIKSLHRLKEFEELRNDKVRNDEKRKERLSKVIEHIKKVYPDRGNGYSMILEYVSTEIESSEAESALIKAAKRSGAGGEKQEDLGLRALSDLINRAVGWRKKRQWELVLFLRGDMKPNRKIRKAFKVVGPERIKRIFDVLPDLARAQTLDSFLDSPKGLIGGKSLTVNWQKKMVKHLLKNSSPKEAQVATDLIDAFMYALKKTGNGPLRSYIISYLYALPKSESASAGHTLKNVLEVFGATGIKIGQFIAASGILPEKETELLRSLNEKANIPLREDIYAELRETFKGNIPHIRLRKVLGAASMKYAVLIKELKSDEEVVLKIFRKESLNHTNMEFNLLDHMAAFLVKRNGAQYTAFRAIINASKVAVKKEQSPSGEVVKTGIAGQKIYDSEEGAVKIKVPRDIYLSPTLIGSEFAEGGSFYDLPESLQKIAAEAIIKQETKNLFSSKGNIVFDPDRHAGNYRIKINEDGQSVTLYPIDFGQLVEIDSSMRDRIVELFSLAQVLAHSGAIEWGAQKLKAIFGDKVNERKLLKNMKLLFPDFEAQPVAAYYYLLASLDGAGLELDIAYFDFIRAVIQIKQYEKFLPDGRDYLTASEILEQKVLSQTDEMKSKVSLTKSEKARYVKKELAQNAQKTSWVSSVKTAFNKYVFGQGAENETFQVEDRGSLSNFTCQSILE